MKYEDVLETIREEIQSEHSLISQRLSWYVGSQSFLLAGLVIAGGQGHAWREFFHVTMPLLGSLLSILALLGVWSAIEVQSDLIGQQKELLTRLLANLQDPAQKAVVEEYNKTTCNGRHSARRFHTLAMTPPWVIPVLFLGVWVAAYFVLRTS